MVKFLTLLSKQRSLQILLLIFLYLCFAPYLPMKAHQAFYTISLFIKDLLLWLLPITVTFFIAHTIFSFEKKAPLFILFLFLFETFSNAMSVWYAFGCGLIAKSHLSITSCETFIDDFAPLWRIGITKPSWWAADKGTFLGLILGLIATFQAPLGPFISEGKKVLEKILTKFFSRLIPLFILGFIAKIYQTQALYQMLMQYKDLLLSLLISLTSYIALLFLMGNRFSLSKALQSAKNLFPATAVAFSSGCSLSTMPWTIEGTSKNLQDPHLAKAIIPATTNIQQIGDCITNSFLAFFIYLHFNGHPPSFSLWISFSTVFVLARFATAAVLGGAIFVMLPIYESYLGFSAEMTAIILAFNVILDPFITSSNVIANGALCSIFEKSWKKFLGYFSPILANSMKGMEKKDLNL